MAPTSSPTVWRRWLAFELRRLRDESGLSQRQVGKACGWSGARLSYIENAQQNVVEDDLAKLLPLYEVPESRWREFAEAVARSREKGWWEGYDDRVVPGYLSLYVGLEQGASLIRCADPVVVPGLLQVADYVAAQMRADVTPRTERQVARVVELRMARQAVVLRDDAPVELSVVIDESVLLRRVGDEKVMTEQLDHLVQAGQRPNVTIRVFPLERGMVGGLVSTYRILTFPDATDSGVVYIEHRSGASYLEHAAEVDGHLLAFEHLVESALSPEDSMIVVHEALDRFSHP